MLVGELRVRLYAEVWTVFPVESENFPPVLPPFSRVLSATFWAIHAEPRICLDSITLGLAVAGMGLPPSTTPGADDLQRSNNRVDQ